MTVETAAEMGGMRMYDWGEDGEEWRCGVARGVPAVEAARLAGESRSTREGGARVRRCLRGWGPHVIAAKKPPYVPSFTFICPCAADGSVVCREKSIEKPRSLRRG